MEFTFHLGVWGEMGEMGKETITIHISHSVDFIFPWTSHAHIYYHSFAFSLLSTWNASFAILLDQGQISPPL